MQPTTKLKWAKFIMFFAAVYNIFWGAVISSYPQTILFGNPPTDFLLIILRCVGMLIGVYGIAYYFASLNPTAYWPLIFVGWLGKLLGPFGSVYYIMQGKLTPAFLWVNLWNDIIWLYPFGWIIYATFKGQLSTSKEYAGNKSLYQKFLGDAYEDLAPNLHAFHQAQTSTRALGQFKVTRGKGLINDLFGKIAQLPQSSEAAEAELILTPFANNEVWSRRLDSKRVISKQWMDGDLLVERFKIINIYLSAEVLGGTLVIYDVAATVLGISLPPFFTPTVLAIGKDSGDSVHVNVEIAFKPFGRIINYQGTVKVCQ
ncbi:hypothetical protein ABIB62_002133 [Mucilaginibacter sp. UYP25]|uniref:DUF4166 domain-containing protein n=1 Tax=unclassified Mucilaginibacter TaxID=2617802 RepID=UPI003391D876